MQQIREVSGKKMTASELFSSPSFYFVLIPHIFSIYLIISNNLGYIYVYYIFLLELLVDNFIVSISVLFTEKKEVQKMYNSNWPRLFLALRSFLSMLGFCVFLGFAVLIFVFREETVFFEKAMTNDVVLLSIGIYFVAKLVNLVFNIFKYKSGQRRSIEDGKSFGINFFALFLLAVPGTHIFLLLGTFVENIQLIAIIILFIIKAFIDAALSSNPDGRIIPAEI